MKRLLILLFIIAGCSEDEVKTTQVSYSDLSGDWKFSSDILSGQFTLTKSGTTYTVASGTYKINGVNHTVAYHPTLSINSLRDIEGLVLNSEEGFIRLEEANFNEDFTEITSITQTYAENCLQVNCPHIPHSATISITRD